MVGITSFGAYIPIYRLTQEAIAKAWDRPPRRGEKAVANFDEDSVTMAVESTRQCMDGLDPQTVDGLFFASTTSPYKEKMAASLIATASDLRNDLLAADFANSLRSGTIAIRAAVNAVKSGDARNVVVTAADSRCGEPGLELEPIFGDAAAAVAIGDSGVVASILASYSFTEEFSDYWRKNDDPYVLSGDARFSQSYGYMRNMQKAITEVMTRSGRKPEDFAKVVLYAGDPRGYIGLAKRLGFNDSQVQDPMVSTVGNCGSASPLLTLVAALEEAKAGDLILVASYGEGSDSLVLEVTDRISSHQARNSVKKQLQSKRILSSYEKYLKFRGLIRSQDKSNVFSSSIMLWREQKQDIRLYGVRCKVCSRIQYPMVRVCQGCGSKDQFDDFKLSKKGTLFTYTKEHYYPIPDPPLTMAILDLDGGGRIVLQMADGDPKEVEIGMPLELTFRKYYESKGLYQYYWKCRPVRGG